MTEYKGNSNLQKILKEGQVFKILKAIEEIEKEEGDRIRIIPFSDLLERIEERCGKECKEIFYNLVIEIPLVYVDGRYEKVIDINTENNKKDNLIEIKTEKDEIHYLTKEQHEVFKLLKEEIFNRFGKILVLTSGYRSCGYQAILFFKTLLRKNLDFNETLKWVAPPGYSDHNAGEAIDTITMDYIGNAKEFKESEEYKFLNELGIMPYQHEPWHVKIKRIEILMEKIESDSNKKNNKKIIKKGRIKEKVLSY